MKNSLRETLVFYRQQRGLTQGALASKLNIDPSCLSKWERGINQIPFDCLPDYAKALGLTLTVTDKGCLTVNETGYHPQMSEDYEEYSVAMVEEAIERSRERYQERLFELQNKLDTIGIILKMNNDCVVSLEDLKGTIASSYMSDTVFELISPNHEYSFKIENTGELDANTFDLNGLLNWIQDHYSFKLMEEIKKAIYFLCVFESDGQKLLRWANQFSSSQRDETEARVLFPYLSIEAFEVLLESMKSENWVDHWRRDDVYPSDIHALDCLYLLTAFNEKEWLLSGKNGVIETEYPLFCLLDTIELALCEWHC